MSEPVQRFTQDARHVLSLAQEEADRQGVAIDTKHLLLALLRDEQGVAGEILRALGLDATQVEALTRKTGRGIFDSEPNFNEQPQPLLILDENGGVLLSNEAAQDLIDHHMDELVKTLLGINGTGEAAIGDRTYFTLSGCLSDVRTFVVMQDITHLKELEREKGYFSGAMLNISLTPLPAIKGYATLLSHHAQWDEKAQQFVDRISANADYVIALLNYWFFAHKLADTRRSSPQRKDFDFKRLVSEVVGHLEGAAKCNSVDIRLELPTEDFQVLGDEADMLGTVWVLVLIAIHNAKQARSHRNQVGISLRRDATHIQLSVQNGGQFTPEEELSVRRFEYRAISAVAEAHGGTFEINSLPDGITEFLVTLPAAQPPE